jgi:hypothetical protein
MKIGKSYWAVSIRNKTAETSMPRKEYSEMRRALRAKASIVLDNLSTEQKKRRLRQKRNCPKNFNQAGSVNESFPVSLGLGWI